MLNWIEEEKEVHTLRDVDEVIDIHQALRQS